MMTCGIPGDSIRCIRANGRPTGSNDLMTANRVVVARIPSCQCPGRLSLRMLGDPHRGSKVWKAPDREIGKPRENRGEVIAHRDLQPTAAFHDRENRRDLWSRLSEGYEVIDTQDPEQALGLALEHKPDAILLDLMMPKFSGFELCQSFRALS